MQTDPICCLNADTQTTVHVILQVPVLPADNLQQLEEASYMGGNANCKSRKSTKGGLHEVTESDTGYHELYMVCNFKKIDPCSCQKSIIQCGPPLSTPKLLNKCALPDMAFLNPLRPSKWQLASKTRLHNTGLKFSWQRLVK